MWLLTSEQYIFIHIFTSLISLLLASLGGVDFCGSSCFGIGGNLTHVRLCLCVLVGSVMVGMDPRSLLSTERRIARMLRLCVCVCMCMLMCICEYIRGNICVCKYKHT